MKPASRRVATVGLSGIAFRSPDAIDRTAPGGCRSKKSTTSMAWHSLVMVPAGHTGGQRSGAQAGLLELLAKWVVRKSTCPWELSARTQYASQGKLAMSR